MNDYQQAFGLLDQLIREKVAAHETPGLAIAITDHEKLLWQANYGYANLDSKAPITNASRFEIGSIGKSFTCLALLKLHEQGKVDLHAPVTDYLPWLDLKSEFDPITAHHLMTHSAGLNTGIDYTPCARYEVWALRNEPIPYAPGDHFVYSNVSYKLLGYLVEDIAGRPYGDLLQEWILDPLGLEDTEALTTHDSRRRLAVGYERFYDDRPWHRSHPMVASPWLEYGAGDGSPVSTAADLATYLRLFLNQGKFENKQLFSEDTMALMTSPFVEVRGHHYGYGLHVDKINGRTHIGHNGGTIGYLATMLGDLDAGFGVIIFVNGPADCDKDAIAEYTLELMQTTRSDNPPPLPPPTIDPRQIENAADYAGIYKSDDKTIQLKAEGKQLILVDPDGDIVLEERNKEQFMANRPDLTLYLLSFKREGGQVVGFGHGADIYAKVGANWELRQIDFPDRWNAYPGHYRAHNPWFSNFRVFLRGGQLFTSYVEYQTYYETLLVELAEGEFQLGQQKTPNRLRFDTIVNGQALRANFYGGDYYRYFTP